MSDMQGSAPAGNPVAGDAAGTQVLSGQQMFNSGSTGVQQTNGDAGQTGSQWYTQLSEENTGIRADQGLAKP